MRRIVLAAYAAGIFTAFAVFTLATLQFRPAERVEPAAAGALAREGCARAVAVEHRAGARAGTLFELASERGGTRFRDGAGASPGTGLRAGAGVQPQGIADLIRRIRRFLRAVRDAINTILDQTNDGSGGGGGPGGTIVNGGLQK